MYRNIIRLHHSWETKLLKQPFNNKDRIDLYVAKLCYEANAVFSLYCISFV